MADNAQMIIDLDRKRMQAMADSDIATLNTLLADDLIYTHSSARLDTKQSLISNMQSGATVYNAVEPSDVKAQDRRQRRRADRCGTHPCHLGRQAQCVRRALHGRLCQQERHVADGDLAIHASCGVTARSRLLRTALSVSLFCLAAVADASAAELRVGIVRRDDVALSQLVRHHRQPADRQPHLRQPRRDGCQQHSAAGSRGKLVAGR